MIPEIDVDGYFKPLSDAGLSSDEISRLIAAVWMGVPSETVTIDWDDEKRAAWSKFVGTYEQSARNKFA